MITVTLTKKQLNTLMVLIDHGVRAVGVRAVPDTAELIKALQAGASGDEADGELREQTAKSGSPESL